MGVPNGIKERKKAKKKKKKEQVDESKRQNRILRLPSEIVFSFELLMKSREISYKRTPTGITGCVEEAPSVLHDQFLINHHE